jgi:hypothetical protein
MAAGRKLRLFSYCPPCDPKTRRRTSRENLLDCCRRRWHCRSPKEAIHVRSVHRGVGAARSRRPPRASRPRGCRDVSAPDRSVEPEARRVRDRDGGARPHVRRAARFRRTRLATALRCPVLDQGPHVDEGNPHHVRLAELRELRPPRRRRDRRPAAACGRRLARQDGHPGIRRQADHGRRPLSTGAKPMEPRAHDRRLERRRGRAGRDRARPPCRGQRRRRLRAHPGRLLRCGRPQTVARTRLARARRGGDLGRALHEWTDHPLGARRRFDARRDGGTRRRRSLSSGAARASSRRGVVSPARAAARSRRARSVRSTPRRWPPSKPRAESSATWAIVWNR